MSKSKRFLIVVLEFGFALAGNLIAGWIQQDVWSNLFTPVRLVGTLISVILMGFVIVWLDSSWSRTVGQLEESRSYPIISRLKPKPRLSITVRDINCCVKRETYKTDGREAPRIAWWVECAVEIRNKSRATATQVTGSMILSLEHREQTLVRESRKTTEPYRLTKPDVRREKVVFEPDYTDPFFQRDYKDRLDFYPDASYRLDYIYSCRERSGTRKATAKGKLTKQDWVGEEQDLLKVRTAGFKVPR
jgi:hypothetical protein